MLTRTYTPVFTHMSMHEYESGSLSLLLWLPVACAVSKSSLSLEVTLAPGTVHKAVHK